MLPYEIPFMFASVSHLIEYPVNEFISANFNNPQDSIHIERLKNSYKFMNSAQNSMRKVQRRNKDVQVVFVCQEGACMTDLLAELLILKQKRFFKPKTMHLFEIISSSPTEIEAFWFHSRITFKLIT
jgi:formyltetrahydrofolate hydrolase